jgi:hypothetical protein
LHLPYAGLDRGADQRFQRIARENSKYDPEIMRTISVKLPDELHAQPSAGAPSCYDLSRDLAGKIKGLPKDLADNPKYMDGFGQ